MPGRGEESYLTEEEIEVLLPDVGIPRRASAVKQHADSLLVPSDENNTSRERPPHRPDALHVAARRKQESRVKKDSFPPPTLGGSEEMTRGADC